LETVGPTDRPTDRPTRQSESSIAPPPTFCGGGIKIIFLFRVTRCYIKSFLDIRCISLISTHKHIFLWYKTQTTKTHTINPIPIPFFRVVFSQTVIIFYGLTCKRTRYARRSSLVWGLKMENIFILFFCQLMYRQPVIQFI